MLKFFGYSLSNKQFGTGAAAEMTNYGNQVKATKPKHTLGFWLTNLFFERLLQIRPGLP